MIGIDTTGEVIGSSVSVGMQDRLGHVVIDRALSGAEIQTMEIAALFSRQNLTRIGDPDAPKSVLTVIGRPEFTEEQREQNLQDVAYTIATALSTLRGDTVAFNTTPIVLETYELPFVDPRTSAV